MKQLQNNFTTPEQSKRLLELGVPRFSADCYYGYYNRTSSIKVVVIDNRGTQYKVITRNDIIPCWSVGRLIEIMGICYEFELPSQGAIQVYKTDIINGSVVNVLISDIERFISKIDFSKLED